jgi:uncharacterized protein (TIGR02265 family)
MQLGSTEPTINARSLKTLIVGNGLVDKPAILESLRRDFGLTYPDLPEHYSFERYIEVLEWLRQKLFPTDSMALGYEKIGRNITRGFFQGPVGQVLKLSINVMGAQRSVRYFFRIMGGALPFGRFEVVEERPRYIRAILYNVPGPPDVTRGMALESMEASNIKQGTITWRKLGPADTEFIARWAE